MLLSDLIVIVVYFFMLLGSWCLNLLFYFLEWMLLTWCFNASCDEKDFSQNLHLIPCNFLICFFIWYWWLKVFLQNSHITSFSCSCLIALWYLNSEILGKPISQISHWNGFVFECTVRKKSQSTPPVLYCKLLILKKLA